MSRRQIVLQLRLGFLLALSLFAGALVSDYLGDRLQIQPADGNTGTSQPHAAQLADL